MIRAERFRWPVFVVATAAIVAGAVLGLLQMRSGAGAVSDVVRRLPLVNASLNATSAVLLITGFVFIRMKVVRVHMAFMLMALFTTCLFLVSYVVYHYHAGSVPFGGTGTVRTVYFVILVSHATLAALVVPLVATVLYRASREEFDRHRKIARWTLPIWLYVSVTGVIIYLMLYVWYPSG